MEEKIIKKTQNGQKAELPTPRAQRAKSVDLRRLIEELDWAPKYVVKPKTSGKDLIVLKPKLECTFRTEKQQSMDVMVLDWYRSGSETIDIELKVVNKGTGPSHLSHVEIYNMSRPPEDVWEVVLDDFTLQDRKIVTIQAGQEMTVKGLQFTPILQGFCVIMGVCYDPILDPRNIDDPIIDTRKRGDPLHENPHACLIHYRGEWPYRG